MKSYFRQLNLPKDLKKANVAMPQVFYKPYT